MSKNPPMNEWSHPTMPFIPCGWGYPSLFLSIYSTRSNFVLILFHSRQNQKTKKKATNQKAQNMTCHSSVKSPFFIKRS